MRSFPFPPLRNILPVVAIVLVILILVFFVHRARQEDFTPEALRESAAVLKNPYQGFYRIFRYTLSDEVQPFREPAIEAYDLPLALLEINLQKYRSGAVSSVGLRHLDSILDAWSRSDTQILLRFVYDWEGLARVSEPESLLTIVGHMDQVSEIVNRYETSIYLMQGAFIGNWGEMHGSYFEDSHCVQTLVNHLHQVIAPSIFLSVRTPAQWRAVTNLRDIPSELPAFQENPPLCGRLGLYNDGMLGSGTDLGTYGDTSRKHASSPGSKGTRAEELAFQNRLCRYVPNGGEVVHDNAYSDFAAAVPYLKTIHASYLNIDYDRAVLDKWSRSHWEGEDAFRGCDGLTYVQAHLGYRYWVSGVRLQRQGIFRLSLELTLENTGFGNTLKPFEAQLLIRNPQTGASMSTPLGFDFRTLEGGQSQKVTLSLPDKDLPQGSCQLFLTVTDPATGTRIALANTTDNAETGLLLGQLDH